MNDSEIPTEKINKMKAICKIFFRLKNIIRNWASGSNFFN